MELSTISLKRLQNDSVLSVFLHGKRRQEEEKSTETLIASTQRNKNAGVCSSQARYLIAI